MMILKQLCDALQPLAVGLVKGVGLAAVDIEHGKNMACSIGQRHHYLAA